MLIVDRSATIAEHCSRYFADVITADCVVKYSVTNVAHGLLMGNLTHLMAQYVFVISVLSRFKFN